jgi:hypothetical protein
MSEQGPKEDHEDANDLSSGAVEHFAKAVFHFSSASRGYCQQVRYNADAAARSDPSQYKWRWPRDNIMSGNGGLPSKPRTDYENPGVASRERSPLSASI